MEIKPRYKQTEVGVIPEAWSVTTVGVEFEIKLGKMLDEKKNVGDPKPYLGNKAVQWGRIDISDLPTVPMSRVDIEKFRLRNGDLLVCEGGEVGRAAIWSAPIAECYYQKALHRLRPLHGFDPRIMAALLRYWADRGSLANYVTQTSIAHLPREKFLDVIMPLPTPSEQNAIAIALSDVDTLIGALDQLIAKKRDLKQAAMQQLLTGRKRLPGFSGAWEVKRLGDVAQADWGNTSITKEAYQDYGYAAFSASGQDGYVSWYEHDGAGVVISAIGAQCGKTWLAFGKWTPIKNTIWFKGDGHEVCTEFLYWKTCDRDFWPKSGQAQPFVSVGGVRNSLFTVPRTLGEQTAIAEVLSDMDAELAALEQRRDKTCALKQGMMQELLTGRIRLV